MDFLVLGAQKCATSWLYYCLRDHQQLHLPRTKEECNYLGGDLYEQRGAEWYFSLVEGAAATQRRGAVSVEYLFDPRSAPAVKEHAHNVQLVVAIRDPIDRAISAYYWYLRRRTIAGSVTLEDAMTEVARVASVGGRQGIRNLGSPYADILERGFYDVQLERYLDCFDTERLFVLLYEDVRRDPKAVLRALYSYLGVNSEFIPRSISKRPKENSYRRGMIALERWTGDSRVMSGLLNRANQKIRGLGHAGRRPALPAGLLEELRSIYVPHVEGAQAIMDDLPAANRSSQGPLVERWTMVR